MKAAIGCQNVWFFLVDLTSVSGEIISREQVVQYLLLTSWLVMVRLVTSCPLPYFVPKLVMLKASLHGGFGVSSPYRTSHASIYLMITVPQQQILTCYIYAIGIHVGLCISTTVITCDWCAMCKWDKKPWNLMNAQSLTPCPKPCCVSCEYLLHLVIHPSWLLSACQWLCPLGHQTGTGFPCADLSLLTVCTPCYVTWWLLNSGRNRSFDQRLITGSCYHCFAVMFSSPQEQALGCPHIKALSHAQQCVG